MSVSGIASPSDQAYRNLAAVVNAMLHARASSATTPTRQPGPNRTTISHHLSLAGSIPAGATKTSIARVFAK